MKIMYVLIYKENVPWKRNGKTLVKANADYRSVIPNQYTSGTTEEALAVYKFKHKSLCFKSHL